jgi:hypothetical protein
MVGLDVGRDCGVASGTAVASVFSPVLIFWDQARSVSLDDTEEGCLLSYEKR